MTKEQNQNHNRNCSSSDKIAQHIKLISCPCPRHQIPGTKNYAAMAFDPISS